MLYPLSFALHMFKIHDRMLQWGLVEEEAMTVAEMFIHLNLQSVNL